MIFKYATVILRFIINNYIFIIGIYLKHIWRDLSWDLFNIETFNLKLNSVLDVFVWHILMI